MRLLQALNLSSRLTYPQAPLCVVCGVEGFMIGKDVCHDGRLHVVDPDSQIYSILLLVLLSLLINIRRSFAPPIDFVINNPSHAAWCSKHYIHIFGCGLSVLFLWV